ncbi:MAG: fatty acyl-AMP ligase [Candidatus Riflebacteria bacterium]|nr:fatty acyl-AMP ligase [Candidatus Riflebacteria bacterium]
MDLASAPHVVALLEERCSREPGTVAFTFLADGELEERSLTRADLMARSRAVAAELSRWLKPGLPVLLLFEPGLDFVAAFWGCLLGGFVAVPVYPPLGRRGKDTLLAIASNVAAPCALSTAALLKRSLLPRLLYSSLRSMKWVATDAIDPDRARDVQAPRIDPDTVAFLQYTSGSIAEPKGVVIRHRNLMANVRTIHDVLSGGASQESGQDCLVSWHPLYHDMGLIGSVVVPPLVEGRSILMSPLHFLQKPVRWLRALSRFGATVSAAPNFAYELCARRVSDEEVAELDLSRWTLAFDGAEPVRPRTLERFAEKLRPAGFRAAALYPTYGLAEGTLLVTGGRRMVAPRVLSVSSEHLRRGVAVPCPEGPAAGATRLVSCGWTRQGLDLRVVDAERSLQLPPGSVGEIWLRGESVADSYWRGTDQSQGCFEASLTEADGGTYLRTGDLGFVHQGELYVTGRLKDLIIVRGHNHYPQDIEATVQNAHSSLRVGCGCAFSVDVEGMEELVVVQEVHRSAAPEVASEIVPAVREGISARHGLQLHALVLIAHGTIPKTSSGKVQRRRCRDLFIHDGLSPWTPTGSGRR